MSDETVVKRNAQTEGDVINGHLELNDQILDSKDLSLKDRVKLFNQNSAGLRAWGSLALQERKLRAQAPELNPASESLLSKGSTDESVTH